MAGSAVGEGGRCSCGGSGVPPALRSPDDPPHPCTPSKAPGFLGKLSSCQSDLDGAWMKHTETRRNQDVATGASARQPPQEGEQRPDGSPSCPQSLGRLALPPREQLSHCAQSPPVQTAVPLWLPHAQRRWVQKHRQPGWV